MKRSSTLFLQAVTVLIGITSLATMLWFPNIEGRNAHSTLFEVYFKDPFLAFAYLASIPYFVALYQVFRLLAHIERNEVFSQRSVKAVRTIKKCGAMLLAFVGTGLLWILLSGSDDKPGGIFLGIVIALGSLVFIAAADAAEGILQNAEYRPN